MNIQSNCVGPFPVGQITDPYGSLRNFELVKHLGEGHFSTVISARNRFTNCLVALKRVELAQMTDAKAIEDCKREIQLLQQLNHPNVIKYISHFVEENVLYIVLELAGAGDLEKMIKHFHSKGKKISEKSIWKFFRQICSGLEHMHSKRIMHRDIKPANIFVNTEGVIRLGDLGLGRFFGSKTSEAFSVVGTPYYMAPERIKSVDSGYDFKSDIWSLGCILYELAALHSPFYSDGLTLPTLLKKILALEYPPLPPSLFSYDLRHLVFRCLALDPKQRPNVSEVHQISECMYTRFVQLANEENNVTPTPTHSNSSYGNVTPVNHHN